MIIDEERKVPGQEQILAKYLNELEKNDFCDFEKPCKRAYQKGKIESNEQSKEGGQPKKKSIHLLPEQNIFKTFWYF